MSTSSDRPNLFGPRNTTIVSVLVERTDTTPNAIAIDAGADVLTFAQLTRASERFAYVLIERGVCPGDRVAIWLPNGTSWAIVQHAIALVGAECVLVSTRATAREAEYIFRNSGVRTVVAAASFMNRQYADEAAQLLSGDNRSSIISVGLLSHEIPEPLKRHSLTGCSADRPAVWAYTSGTTGVPKATPLTHRVWTNNAALTAATWGLSAEDRVYSPCPLFFAFGSMTAMMGAITSGASFHTSCVFSVPSALDRIRATRTTWFVGVPTMWTDLLDAIVPGELPYLRGGTWGGGSFPTHALAKAVDPDLHGLNMTAIYGMTEAPSIAVISGHDPIAKRLTSVGRAGPLIDLRIVDEKGAEVPTGMIGQVVTRGYHTTAGYLDNEAETAKLYSGGWLQTGDLGSLDQDGYLSITGRLTDMILVGGSNVYAREVEDVILNLKGVQRAAVIGMPHKRLGEIPIAWIQCETRTIDEEMVLTECRRQLANYKVPAKVHIVSAMPMTATGKINKAALKGMAS
ncbi:MULTISPECIES: class I adenylate-forming enzyme family protein [unclassified Bradyrhizobium]|uniref:class I adenylate-forming enzyme family protein n=1 Tax=unclassified Bradyrhizobium TaxID=2631580 RepID=UPI0021136D01|nr:MULTISPECIES: class I adenylate-forming enzyme family protein [unclassified Bradyrhizobium]MCK1348701.1 acyl--CoA ligase [Bradyrhizobium sp. CW11]MCK1700411.1 acyl--CoA ligase [Bradyrhizobium sp. 146]